MPGFREKPPYKSVGAVTPFDERDNVHARYELVPDTQEWNDYYQKHPKWERIDLKTKFLPGMGKVGHPWDLPILGNERTIIRMLCDDGVVEGIPSPEKQVIGPERAAEKIKGVAHHLGADLVRIGPLNPAFVYSHIGKTRGYPGRRRGAPISLSHTHAISLAIGLNTGMIKTGPVLPEYMEVLRAYLQLAMISVTLAGYIRSLGYPARAHNLLNYQVLCVPVAIDAGMGQLGRHGLMLTKEFGSCLKLAVVTTDLPLTHDPTVNIGVDDFCAQCRICAESCPSKAIPTGDKVVVRGVEKWRIIPEACFYVWNETGTDCGVCVASCPWTKPTTPFHNLAREFATRGGKAGAWMSRLDRLLYGTFKPKVHPDWMEKPEYPSGTKYEDIIG
jgi:ferredoxin